MMPPQAQSEMGGSYGRARPRPSPRPNDLAVPAINSLLEVLLAPQAAGAENLACSSP